MIIKKQTEIVRSCWQKASKELGFKLITPYFLDTNDTKKQVFGFLPEYGSPQGMVIELTVAPEYQTDKYVVQWAKENNCFCSFINLEFFLTYNQEYFKEALEDWGRYESHSSLFLHDKKSE